MRQSKAYCLARRKTNVYHPLYEHIHSYHSAAVRVEALKRSAKALKKTESEYIRDFLQRDLDMQSFTERAKHLIGCLDFSETVGVAHPLRELIRERNWRK